MEDHHRKILQTSFVFLTKNIRNVEDVCDYLVADEVLTFDMLDTIKTAQVRELISTLPHHGKQAYESFIHALTKTENQDSADFLRSKEEWPDLTNPGSNFRKRDLKNSDKENFSMIMQERKETYSMAGTDKGEFILISNVALSTVCPPSDTEETEKNKRENERRSKYRNNIDFDITNIGLVLKAISWKSGGQFNNKASQTYSMAGTDKGKFILISNVACPTVCPPPDTEETEKNKRETERRSKCRNDIDFDTTNIGLVLKAIGWKSGGRIKNKASQEIIESLTSLLDEIDKDAEADPEVNFDSLVVIILSGKIDCQETKIYDKDGNNVSREKIQQIIKNSRHFKGKQKIVFIQTYNFEEISPCDELETASNEIIKGNYPNSDDLFVVSSYPRIEQGPWMIGENMCGSYFIQALIHIFTNHAYNKSFLDLMGELQKCLVNAVVPEMTNNRKNKDTLGRKHVADVVLLEYSKQKELYLFPGYTHQMPKLRLENIDLGASFWGTPVFQPSA